jgi:hypothetical protein
MPAYMSGRIHAGCFLLHYFFQVAALKAYIVTNSITGACKDMILQKPAVCQRVVIDMGAE